MIHDCGFNYVEAFSVKRVASDGNCLFQSLVVLNANDEKPVPSCETKELLHMYLTTGISSKNM
jgi:hypothetical protein